MNDDERDIDIASAAIDVEEAVAIYIQDGWTDEQIIEVVTNAIGAARSGYH